MTNQCAACNATDVRLYRPGGEFFRPERVRCAPCARTATLGSHELNITEIGIYVPLIRSKGGQGEPWQVTTIPPGDLDAWFDLPEN